MPKLVATGPAAPRQRRRAPINAVGWDELVARVEYARESAGPYGLWFRGQRQPWQLDSPLVREFRRHPAAEQPGMVRQASIDFYGLFKSRAWSLLDPSERGRWDILFTMRHHAVPTPLLDFTENLACALFFALRGGAPLTQDRPIVVLLVPGTFNLGAKALGVVPVTDDLLDYHPEGTPSLDKKLPSIAVAPNSLKGRMVAQRSTFVLQGNSEHPIDAEEAVDDEVGELPDSVWILRLDADACTKGCQLLHLMGLTWFDYFPDLTSIAQDVKSHFGIPDTDRRCEEDLDRLQDLLYRIYRHPNDRAVKVEVERELLAIQRAQGR